MWCADDDYDDTMVGCDAGIPFNLIHNRGRPKKYIIVIIICKS